MLLILLAVLILHLITLVLLFVSTAANAWTTAAGGSSARDLWYNCEPYNQGYHCKPATNEDWIQAVQALMVLSVLFCFFSLIAFVYQLFKLVKGGRFFFTAVFQILASLFVMCGAIIYTVMRPEPKEADAAFGYAYVLAWVAFPLSLISGLIYIVLRKRE